MLLILRPFLPFLLFLWRLLGCGSSVGNCVEYIKFFFFFFGEVIFCRSLVKAVEQGIHVMRGSNLIGRLVPTLSAARLENGECSPLE
jgi:hypothetical protein